MHLITDTAGDSALYSRKLETFRTHMSIETAAHTQSGIARLNARRLLLVRRKIKKGQQRPIGESRDRNLFESTRERFGRAALRFHIEGEA